MKQFIVEFSKGGAVTISEDRAVKLSELIQDDEAKYVSINGNLIKKSLIIRVVPKQESEKFIALPKPKMKTKPMSYYDLIRKHNEKKNQ